MHLFVNNNRYEYWKWQKFENIWVNLLRAVKNKNQILRFHDCDVKKSLHSVVRKNLKGISTENYQSYKKNSILKGLYMFL